MKIKSLNATVAALSLCALGLHRVSAQDEKPSPELLAKAKITHDQAEKIALDLVPKAKVKASELEMEGGGLRWSFDLKKHGTKSIIEVGVDAVTGKVVENKEESAAETAKEAATDEASAKK
jgi:uncharacterized membrane protein YkoI